MRILFLVDNFPPEVAPPAIRSWEHCTRWAKAGHEITVLTSNPNFPSGRLFEGHKNRLYHRERSNGLTIIRVWTFMAANQGFALRILDFLSFAFSSFLAGLFVPTDVIVASSPQFFVGLSARGLAGAKRKPWVFEVRDLWPESIAALGMLGRGRIYRALERLELHFYRSAAAVLIVSEGFRTSLTRRGIPSAKIFTVPNGADLSAFSPGAPKMPLKRQLGLDGKFVVGFMGTLGLAHGIDAVLDCAASMASEGIHFLFVGDGAKKAELVARAQQEELANVTFLDPVPRNEIPDYLALCDAALVNLIASETFLSVIPSKIFEAAALERPILLGVDGTARELIEEFCAGLYYPPGDREALMSAIRRMRTDHDLYSQLQTGCRLLARAYDRERLAIQALEIICRSARPPSGERV